ncbi:MAG: hypothetical protein H6R10_3215 [Rhodocyclaceae bacterium]|nr:hypothetical protein [Rhodocyclaceae bacterium]
MKIGPLRWNINEDADRELRYWMNELFAALGSGAVFALATGGLIALVPGGEDHAGGQFARDFWPYLVECAFWLGMFVGMLWGAGKRIGSALAGSLPWQEAKEDRQMTGRFFGQWSAFAALMGFFLWFTPQVALAAGLGDMALFTAGFIPVSTACWLAAGLFAAIALASRRQPRTRRGAWPDKS